MTARRKILICSALVFAMLACGTTAPTPKPPDVFLTGMVWKDNDQDGQQDVAENGLPGVTVKLFREEEGIFVFQESTLSANAGLFDFPPLAGGFNYQLEFVEPAGYHLTGQDLGDDNFDSDVNPITGRSVSTRETIAIDAGMIPEL